MSSVPVVSYQLDGLGPALRQLGKLEPDLRKELRANFRQELNVVRDDARRAMPASAPLSGMAHRGRTGYGRKAISGITVATGGRTRRGDFVVAGLRQSNAAGVIYDMVGSRGRAKTPQGAALIANMPGRPSRVMWPTVERNQDRIATIVEDFVNGVTDGVNRNFR